MVSQISHPLATYTHTPFIDKGDEKNEKPIESSETITSVPKALYKQGDDRYNICNMKGSFSEDFIKSARENAKSVACLMLSSNLIPGNKPGSFRLIDNIRTLEEVIISIYGIPLAEGSLFGKEPCAGDSTAFRIGPDTLLTAGHCVTEPDPTQDTDRVSRGLEKKRNILSKDRIKNLKIVFGFKTLTSGAVVKYFSERNVYLIKYVQHFNYDGCNDFAVLVTTRKMSDHIPIVKLSLEKPKLGDSLSMIGYPESLPLKLAAKGTVKKVKDEYSFETNISAFHGNSGSPMFNEKGESCGILIRGNKDRERVEQYGVHRQPRIIASVITDERIRTHGYEICRYITKDMFDSIERLYCEATEARRELSEKNSKKLYETRFEEKDFEFPEHKLFELYFRISKDIGVKNNTLLENCDRLGFSDDNTLHSPISFNERIKEIQKKFSEYNLNKLEAGTLFAFYNRHKVFSNDEIHTWIELSRNISSFSITPLFAYEIGKFSLESELKFSPFNILKLFEYEKELGSKFSKDKRIEILKYMTAKNPETQDYYTVKAVLEEMKHE